MSAVTNQLPYQELKVIAPTKEVHPFLMRLVQRVIFIASMFFLTTVVGMMIALGNWGISLFSGSIIGAIVGLIFGSVVAFRIKLPTNVEQYRLQVLSQLKSVLSNPRALFAIRDLENFFYYPFTGFIRHFDQHTLHKKLSILGDAILTIGRPDAEKIWIDFLKHLHGTKVQMPDKKEYMFNAVFLVQRFIKQQRQVKGEWLGFWFAPEKEDIEEIEKIGKVSFGESLAFSKEDMLSMIKQNRPSGLRVMRDQGTGKVLGYGWYYTEGGVVKIKEIARLPEASYLNIGTQILYDILRAQKKDIPVHITLRKSNPFQFFLQQFGFVNHQVIPNHYLEFPPEEGIVMQLDWQKYAEMRQKL